MPKGIRTCHALLLSLLAASPGVAGDGVLEINQVCAEQTGCFPGDTPGFPVTLSQPGSYRLTGILDLSLLSPPPTGIHVTAHRVTIDLNGFGILGPCTTVVGCPGSAHGIDGGGFTGGPTRTTVRNGFVALMPGAGIHLGGAAVVSHVDSSGNGGNGIHVQTVSRISHSTASGNGDDGFDVDDASVVSNCVATGNIDDGVEAEGNDIVIANTSVVSNGGEGIERQGRVSEQANACDDGSCSRRGKRRFYLTLFFFDGANALAVCDAGFHMASLWEIFDPSDLVYDALRPLARTTGDSGQGPPTGLSGWIRTGHSLDNVSATPGTSNCNGFSTVIGTGTFVSVTDDWNDPSEAVSPWIPATGACTTIRRVWCVED